MRRKLALLLCAGVPLSFFVWTLSGASYWLDAGEFVASAIDLDIAHPPGHPLTSLYGKLFTLLPFASLAARVALGQAVAGAGCALCLFRAAESSARALGLRNERLLLPIAILAGWLSVFGYVIWFQAIRPEVYALQAALLCFAMERIAAYETAAVRDARPVYAAALAVGLGLTNHHLMAFFLFPALFVAALGASARTRSFRPLAICAGLGVVGLLVYAYLPLRAARHPPANLGDPVTLERLYWVVSARVYARGMGHAYPQPLGERFADVGVVLCEQLLVVFVPLALLGVYALLRSAAGRRVGVFWLLAAIPVLCIRPWLGSVRGNPDALAYLSGGCCAAAVLASAGVAALLSVFDDSASRVVVWVERGLALMLSAIVCFAAVGRAPRFSLADFHATDRFDDYRVRALPPRSVLVAATPQLVFRAFELRASEAVRPDVALVPLPFLRYPGVADAVIRRAPELRALVDAFLRDERLDPSALDELARKRPVLFELESHLPTSAFASSLPAGLLYSRAPPAFVQRMLRPANMLQNAAYARIEADLGRGIQEIETARQLLWLHYMDALYYTAQAEPEYARASLARAQALFPEDVQLHALAVALAQLPTHGRLDVSRFLDLDTGTAAP